MSVCTARIGEILDLQRRVVALAPGASYQEIGVRSFGKGLFLKEPLSGADLGDKRVFSIATGDLIVSNVFAWEGAVGVAGPEHNGRIGSHRFMTWTPLGDAVDAGYLRHYFGSDAGLEQLRQASPGSAGRNRTLSIKNFEAIEVPLPDLAEQRRIANHLEALQVRTAGIRNGSRLDSRALLAFLPRVTTGAFLAAGLPTVRLEELCSNVNRTIHPEGDRLGATEFVGLEHIESHTGRSSGGRPLREEKGRKLLFREGEVTYGYLRPYLNKVWVADRTGLCSVEQFVLLPNVDVDARLLAHLLRSSLVLDAAVQATHNLQLPRLRLERLMSIVVPDIRRTAEVSNVIARLDEIRDRVQHLAGLAKTRHKLIDALLPAARNEIFSAMR